MYYYEVSPIIVVRDGVDSFTYASPKSLHTGTVVEISIGKKNTLGIVLEKVEKPLYKTKGVSELVGDKPLPLQLIRTSLWLSSYYRTPLATVWQTVLPRGLNKKRRATPVTQAPHQRNRTKNVFTKEQTIAIKTINDTPSGPILLHGITGSGKTLIYIESTKRAIEDGKSAIILTPEISLTSQLVAEFSQHFPDIVLIHSRQTEAEKHISWQKILNSSAPLVVIGPRSALFAPLHNLGLIVIDESHEPSYKQEQSPRYSAIELAKTLAKHHKAKVIMGSATPSVADYYLHEKTKTPIITMFQPARPDVTPPEVDLIDMTKRNKFTRHHFLSNILLDTLENTFSSNHQALIFHNRRGTASTTLCQNCSWQAGCPRCFIPLTLHSDNHQLACHICNFNSPVPTSCPQCHHADIVHKGFGTKRIESELKKLFPKINIARFDGDATADNTVEKRYQDIYDGKINLIIGTQVIAKGLDLPRLRTVGIVQADAGLALPDFSSAERTFQLLNQATGRVGRSAHHTRVIIQSYQPNHPAIQDGVSHNYKNFYERTLALRQHTNFPPFCHLLKLVCVYKTEKTAIKNSRQLASELKRHAPSRVQILGPSPAFYERVRDTYRWQLVIKSPSRQDLVKLLDYLPKNHWQFELDPTSLL